MELKDLQQLYSKSPQVRAVAKTLEDNTLRSIFLKGLTTGAMPVVASAVQVLSPCTMIIIMTDEDEAGYVYNDLCHLADPGGVFFFPSSFRRAAKYAQRDAANEILRTESLSFLANNPQDKAAAVITYPAAMAELVARKESVSSKLINVRIGQKLDITEFEHQLFSLGFSRTDYVYEPGQVAIRGSIVDVFSCSSELPFRIDFFGDEVDSVRTFELDTQLSTDKKQEIQIIPSLSALSEKKVPFSSFLPEDCVVIANNLAYVIDKIKKIYDEGFSTQAMQEKLEGATATAPEAKRRTMSQDSVTSTTSALMSDISKLRLISYGQHPPDTPQSVVTFSVTSPLLFHKNFQLLKTTLGDYQSRGYHTYILADNDKQHKRLNDILSAQNDEDGTAPCIGIPVPINGILHEGFIDNNLKCCFFTDHQIFDRFHKYNLKSDKVRAGKMSLTMKELQEMEAGDYLVHIDFGIGKFGGLVRKPTDKGYIEEIRLIYQRGDIVDISIHSLYKISKYRRQNTEEPPRLSTLGTGAWERLKENTKRKIKDIARDLIKLYANRRQEKGFSFSPDTYLQQELEASFLYEDTRPAPHNTRGEKRHGVRPPYGPPHLRRCRVR